MLRTSLGVLAAGGLLLGACGGDDDSGDDAAATSTTGAGGGGAVCELLTMDQLNQATGEDFSKASSSESDQCEYSDGDGTAVVRLATHVLAEGEQPSEFMQAGTETCDEGTLDQDPGIDGADPAFTCLVESAPLVAGIHEGTVYLLQAVTVDASIASDQVVDALAELLPQAYA
jgi:hypothetical protein